MDALWFVGVFDLPWWGAVAVALGLTHVTIAAVTIYLHRHQAHHAIALHPVASHFFRFWLWLTTGMVTKEWAAVHRKHHAKCETPEDPHSPQVLGIHRVLWGGVFLYIKEARRAETLARYGHGTPGDWLEHKLYSRLPSLGLILMSLITCRYDVLARYARSLKRVYAQELAKLRRAAPEAARALETLEPELLSRDEKMLRGADRVTLAAALPQSAPLQTMYAMRRELIAVWGRSTATREQLVRQLQDWCHRAEASGVQALAEFSLLLRRYA